MTRRGQARARWCLVVLFAVGMAWVEAASVYYLRTAVDRIEPYQLNPLPMHGVLGPVELVREAATLVMLLTVGMLSGFPARQPASGGLVDRTWHTSAGYAALAFGVWDILYYVFLRLISGWPKSLFDWDVLFLLPLPWWGPVLAPICIASLMIAWGTLATRCRDGGAPMPVSESVRATFWGFGWLGIALALYVFMADSLRMLHQDLEAVTRMLPGPFNWPLFSAALVLMAVPVAHMAWRGVLERVVDDLAVDNRQQ